MHFLRNRDRECHSHSYPTLFYPEIYLLEGGYKDFFESHKVLCEPVCYKPMTHSDHIDDLRHFRSKSKSWESEGAERTHTRVRTSRQLSEEMPSTARRICRKLPWLIIFYQRLCKYILFQVIFLFHFRICNKILNNLGWSFSLGFVVFSYFTFYRFNFVTV